MSTIWKTAGCTSSSSPFLRPPRALSGSNSSCAGLRVMDSPRTTISRPPVKVSESCVGQLLSGGLLSAYGHAERHGDEKRRCSGLERRKSADVSDAGGPACDALHDVNDALGEAGGCVLAAPECLRHLLDEHDAKSTRHRAGLVRGPSARHAHGAGTLDDATATPTIFRRGRREQSCH